MAAPTCIQTYDAKTNIVHVSFPKVHLESQDEIRRHFDRVVAFWRDNCGGKKVYYVVNYDGLSVNLRENDFYAQQMRRVLEHAITVVRYGGDSLQRTAARLYSMKLHSPTRLYASREEALKVVLALQAGEMTIEPPA
jgi:hypothetical protein